jgi:hypothetical protein
MPATPTRRGALPPPRKHPTALRAQWPLRISFVVGDDEVVMSTPATSPAVCRVSAPAAVAAGTGGPQVGQRIVSTGADRDQMVDIGGRLTAWTHMRP